MSVPHPDHSHQKNDHREKDTLEVALEVIAGFREVRGDVGEVRKELGELRHLVQAVHNKQETILMALDAEGKAVVAAIDAATTDISDAIGVATTVITDLAAKVAAGSITPAELMPALQPALDTMKSAANALRKTATALDPAVNPQAAPIPEIPVPVVPPASDTSFQ